VPSRAATAGTGRRRLTTERCDDRGHDTQGPKRRAKAGRDLTPILPAVFLPVLTDATPANASTPHSRGRIALRCGRSSATRVPSVSVRRPSRYPRAARRRRSGSLSRKRRPRNCAFNTGFLPPGTRSPHPVLAVPSRAAPNHRNGRANSMSGPWRDPLWDGSALLTRASALPWVNSLPKRKSRNAWLRSLSACIVGRPYRLLNRHSGTSRSTSGL
jgi:hypothetical protein